MNELFYIVLNFILFQLSCNVLLAVVLSNKWFNYFTRFSYVCFIILIIIVTGIITYSFYKNAHEIEAYFNFWQFGLYAVWGIMVVILVQYIANNFLVNIIKQKFNIHNR